ncbi:MAG: polysaccharide biosynthesis tyrosine autokinase [Proteobacteria bacterium]|nr:polysaccharide biosynthesis tyrosine autokinase [Pseudomonadota bacterium]
MQQDHLIGDGRDRDNNFPTQPQSGALTPSMTGPDRLLPVVSEDDDRNRDTGEIDLRHLLDVLLKRKWTIIATFGIVVLAALLMTLLKTPIYRASTTIQIDRDAMQVIQVQGVNDANNNIAVNDDAYYKTQYQLLQSIALERRVAASLHLKDDQDYLQRGDASRIKRLFSMVSPAAKGNPSSNRPGSGWGDKDDQFMQNNLSINPIRDTHLVTINFDSANPDLAAKIANAFANTFIAVNLEHNYNSTAYARQYLEGRLAELKKKLADSKQHLITLATTQRLFLDANGAPTLSNTNLDSLTQALVVAQDARTKAEARWKFAQALPDAALPGDEVVNSAIFSLQQQRATLVADYQLKLKTFKPGYPLMEAEKSQIDALDKQISATYSGIRSSMRAEYEAALAHEKMAKQQLESEKSDALAQQSRSIDYSVALQDVQTNQQLYNDMLERYKEIGIAGGITSNNMSVVDSADVPTKVFRPRLLLNLLVASILGLGLGIGLALSLDYFDDTIKSPADIEKLLGLAVLGIIPRLKDTSPKEALQDLRSAFAEAYRSVRTALQFSTNAGVPKSLLVTSATPMEGKSTTALTIAINFIQLGKSVLLIDADMRNPSQHRSLELSNEKGLSSFLSGVDKPSDVIQVLPDSGLHVITSGPLPPNPAELLAGPKLLSMLTVAAAKYDQIIIDGPPTLGIADALIIAHVTAGTMVVIAAGTARRAVVKDSLKRLMSARARLIGAVLNKFDPKMAGYGYSYGYGYGAYSYYAYGNDRARLTKQ